MLTPRLRGGRQVQHDGGWEAPGSGQRDHHRQITKSLRSLRETKTAKASPTRNVPIQAQARHRHPRLCASA